MKLKKVLFYGIALMLGGCVPSAHPLFTDNQIIFDANLIGTWSEPNSSTYWQFNSNDDKKYEVIYDEDGKIGKFEGMLGQIGDNLYLDVFPDELDEFEIPTNAFYRSHFPPMHSFIKMKLSKNSLEMNIMNPDGIEKLLDADPNAVEYEKTDRIILTASTEQLQAFIATYCEDEEWDIFGESEDTKPMYRVNWAGE